MDQANATVTKTPARRMADIFKWCDARGIGQPYSFFRGCDNALDQYEARIRLVIRTRTPLISDTDLPWVESMELTIAALNNRKSAA